MNKKAQQSMGFSFGMLFSIFLIVVFIVVAFIGIKAFLSFGETATVAQFYDNLQREIDDAWQSPQTSTVFEINLPKAITHVCFANLTDKAKGENAEIYNQIKNNYYDYSANLFLIPAQAAQGSELKTINNINLTIITQTHNPYCIETSQSMKITKELYSRTVVIQ